VELCVSWVVAFLIKSKLPQVSLITDGKVFDLWPLWPILTEEDAFKGLHSFNECYGDVVESNGIPENETTERLGTNQENQDAIASKTGIKARIPPLPRGRERMGIEILSFEKKRLDHMVYVVWLNHIGFFPPYVQKRL